MSRPIGRPPGAVVVVIPVLLGHKTLSFLNKPRKSQRRPSERCRRLDGREQEGCARKRSAPWSKIGQDGKAVEYLLKDCEALLAFSDFPAGHLEISAHEQRHRSSRETTAYLD